MSRTPIRGLLISYVKSRRNPLILFFTFAAVFFIIFFLYDIALDAVIYASVLCGTIGAVFLVFDFIRFYRRHEALLFVARNVSTNIDGLPRPETAIESDYDAMIRSLYKSVNSLISDNLARDKYLNDYYTMWVHQIKIPISAMHILLEDDSKSSPMNVKLFEIEQYVEMALSYMRLESDYTDYVFREYPLDGIVKQAVRKYSSIFISKKIGLDIEDTDIKVTTDEKWLQFVIEQILSNSLKYTRTGRISINYEAPATLRISDTGIGIAPEDIPRIGQKGFTGCNGREFKKSTGLGLYLCREILGRLSHTMEISSEVGKGTTVSIDMRTRRLNVE